MEDKRLAVDVVIGFFYAIAAVSGGIGGCAVSCYYLTHDKHPRLAFASAYTVIGIVFGILTFAGVSLLGYEIDGSVHKLILYAAAGGFVSAITLASVNMSVRIMLKRLGMEVELTVRRSPTHDRRESE
jgi:hypothetical protein